jgi:hypothetical protein
MNQSQTWAALVLAAGITGACGPVDDDVAAESSAAASEELASTTQAFQNSLSFVNCGQAQIERIQRAANVLSDRLFEDQGRPFRNCLADAFIGQSAGHGHAGAIWKEFNQAGVTTIACSNSLEQDCGGVHDWWGCAGVGTSSESIRLANTAVNDPNISDAAFAGLIAHELAHNHGHGHIGSGADYESSVPQRVRACVANGNSLPVSASRSAGMPGEVELGPHGGTGGLPFEQRGVRGFDANGDDITAFATGLTSYSGSRVDGVFLTGPGTSPPIAGTRGGTRNDDTCGSGEYLVGVFGRAGRIVDQIGALCGDGFSTPRALSARGSSSGGTPFRSACPTGKAVRYLRTRAAAGLDRVQVVCDDIGEYYNPLLLNRVEHTPPGSITPELTLQNCSGHGVMTALIGRAKAEVDRLSGSCTATTGMNPVVLSGPVHLMTPMAGGAGGDAFTNACNAGDAMVGVEVRAGSRIDAVRPICAAPATWNSTGDGEYTPPSFSGGSGGTRRTMTCSGRKFVTGLQIRADGRINSVVPVCSSLRLPSQNN